jgi:hypothetical protein
MASENSRFKKLLIFAMGVKSRMGVGGLGVAKTLEISLLSPRRGLPITFSVNGEYGAILKVILIRAFAIIWKLMPFPVVPGAAARSRRKFPSGSLTCRGGASIFPSRQEPEGRRA